MQSLAYIAPVALAAALVVGGRAVARRLLRRALPYELPLATAQLALTWAVLSARLWLAAGVLGATALIGTTVAGAAVAHIAWGRRPHVARHTSLAPAAVVVGAVALTLAVGAAAFLPVWQWDALGYHLPFVDFVVRDGSLAALPTRVPYLSTYPHAIDLAFAAWRCVLPDDAWVDVAQVPFGLMGAVATASLARRLGARSDVAGLAGATWLALPAVLTQLPSNYVDVGSAACLLCAAAWTLGPMRRTRVLLAGLALGLYLGSKPNAPLGVALVGALLFLRARRHGLVLVALAALGVALAIGGETYARNVLAFGNPVWPVRLSLGPWTLPGRYPMAEVLRSGQSRAHRGEPLPLRVLGSWLDVTASAGFDMRHGGLGPLAPAILVGALLALRARVRRVALVPLAAALASPDPSVPRFVLAWPAVALALCACTLTDASARVRRWTTWAAVALATIGAVAAVPGLAGDAATLREVVVASPQRRALLLGPEGAIEAWSTLRDGPDGRVIAYDASFELSHLLWRPDLRNRVVRVPDGLTPRAVERWLDGHAVTAVVAGDDEPAGRAARAAPSRYVALFPCVTDVCHVYAIRRHDS